MDALRLRQVVADYAQTAPEQLLARLEARIERSPRCAVSRYLLGCQYFDRGRSAEAVRQMMVAHHAEPDFESAALLVFAGLNWVSRRGARLLPVLLETWEEFRRPEFDRYPRERALLNAFAAAGDGLEQVSPLARRLWRLPIQTLRAQIRQAVSSRDAAFSNLLTLPA